MLMGLHRPAAAGAAVADGVEPPEHSILEECVVDVAALILGAQDFHGFLLRNPPRPPRMVFLNNAGKWVANDQAHV